MALLSTFGLSSANFFLNYMYRNLSGRNVSNRGTGFYVLLHSHCMFAGFQEAHLIELLPLRTPFPGAMPQPLAAMQGDGVENIM